MIIIEKLTEDHNIASFNCGDSDLNEFLCDNAIPFQDKRIATTYVVIIDEKVSAYFSLLNDKISRTDISKSSWRKLKKLFAHSKHRSNYPAIKIGRFAVSQEFASQGLGSSILDAIPFYLKNGFIEMLPNRGAESTRTMYLDMLNF